MNNVKALLTFEMDAQGEVLEIHGNKDGLVKT